MHVKRNLLVLMALATMAQAPALGETPGGAAQSGAQRAAAIPDFSGIWSHPYLTGFELPFSGAGPVLNRSRRPDGVADFQRLVALVEAKAKMQ